LARHREGGAGLKKCALTILAKAQAAMGCPGAGESSRAYLAPGRFLRLNLLLNKSSVHNASDPSVRAGALLFAAKKMGRQIDGPEKISVLQKTTD